VNDGRQLMIKSIYDREKCINEIYDANESKIVEIDIVNRSLPKDKHIPKMWRHNLGKVPVKFITNKPIS
jgi:hypothetical protein